jgi:hypothetical protein
VFLRKSRVCVPKVIADPTSRFSWTAFCVSAALSACAWVIAHAIPAAR